MGKEMVKEHSLGLMEESMKGNLRMVKKMVKENTQTLMVRCMSGNGRMD